MGWTHLLLVNQLLKGKPQRVEHITILISTRALLGIWHAVDLPNFVGHLLVVNNLNQLWHLNVQVFGCETQ